MIELHDSNFIIETEKFMRALKIDEILFFRAEGCYTEINMISKEKILLTKTLKEVHNLFRENCFCRCHKSYLINLQYFKELKKNNRERKIILDNDLTIPISQRKYVVFKESLKNYMCTLN